MRSQCAAVGMCGLILLPTLGCAETSKNKPVFKVYGRLTFEGNAMARATISFYSVNPNDRSTPSHGIADDDGRYELHTYKTGDGAPAGEYIVTIHWPGPRRKQPPSASPDLDTEAVSLDRLKNVYSLVGTSKLRATVLERDNEIDFKLP